MKAHAFDDAVRYLATKLPRRSLILPALPAAIFLGGAGLLGGGAAKKKRKRKNKKKIKRNEFGCVNVGMFCTSDDQCCSGICQGKKGKKKCQAHDAEGCQAGQVESFCGGVDVLCTTSAGETNGACDTTTGNAGFCTGAGDCFTCTKDADCVPFCGPAAACIVCGGACAEVGTACVGPDECTFPPI